MAPLRLIIAQLLAAGSTFAIQLWETPGDIPTSVPARCRVSLTQNITCELLVKADIAASGHALFGEAANLYCGDTCRSSMESFHSKVIAGCGDTEYELWENSSMPIAGKTIVDGLLWAQRLMCIEDDSGYCLNALYGGNRTACSDCALKYGAMMVSSDYGRARYPEKAFKSVLSSCSVPESSYTYTYTSVPSSEPPPTTTDPSPAPTCTGETYVVQEGDTCESISLGNSVATDRMIEANYLDYTCNRLSPGLVLCIIDKCKLLTIEANQTCDSIVEGRGFSTIQLQSWNPTLKSMCNNKVTPNLDRMIGRSICIEAPGDSDFPDWTEPTNTTTKPKWTLTSPFITSWEPGTINPTASPGPITMTSMWDPDYTPPVSQIEYNETHLSIAEEYTKDCWITEEDWEHGFDPENMPAACQSLMETYCYYSSGEPSPTTLPRAPGVCTPDRSTYTAAPLPEPVKTPLPYQPNMTKGCNKFYKVKSGDTCDWVAVHADISLADFYAWNPDVGSDCGNLQTNVYVCVGFDPLLIPDVPMPTWM